MVDEDDMGYVASPMYPHPYPMFLNCHTLLMAPEGYQVILKFLYFDWTICSSGDYFAVYDGSMSDPSKLLTNCSQPHRHHPPMLSSTHGALLIIFTSDGQNVSSHMPGFKLLYHLDHRKYLWEVRALIPKAPTIYGHATSPQPSSEH